MEIFWTSLDVSDLRKRRLPHSRHAADEGRFFSDAGAGLHVLYLSGGICKRHSFKATGFVPLGLQQKPFQHPERHPPGLRPGVVSGGTLL